MPLKIPRQRAREPETPGVRGAVRVDARTKNLTKRLRPGEIAVINHQDIDKVSAEALLACRPAAVVNAAPSISGRYPNLGPEILIDAGVPLLDNVGVDVMHTVHEAARDSSSSTSRSRTTIGPLVTRPIGVRARASASIEPRVRR